MTESGEGITNTQKDGQTVKADLPVIWCYFAETVDDRSAIAFSNIGISFLSPRATDVIGRTFYLPKVVKRTLSLASIVHIADRLTPATATLFLHLDATTGSTAPRRVVFISSQTTLLTALSKTLELLLILATMR